jgi:hypothetical protein
MTTIIKLFPILSPYPSLALMLCHVAPHGVTMDYDNGHPASLEGNRTSSQKNRVYVLKEFEFSRISTIFPLLGANLVTEDLTWECPS